MMTFTILSMKTGKTHDVKVPIEVAEDPAIMKEYINKIIEKDDEDDDYYY